MRVLARLHVEGPCSFCMKCLSQIHFIEMKLSDWLAFKAQFSPKNAL